MSSARKLRDQKLQESTSSSSKILPQKRSTRVVYNDSADSEDEPRQPVRSSSRNHAKEVEQEIITPKNIGGKRQKKDSNIKNSNIGADFSSPDKLASTKQSDEDDQHYLSQTATRSSKRANDPTAYQSPSKPELISTGQTLDNYLNEVNLKHLERISKQVKLDFNFFTKDLIREINAETTGVLNISSELRQIEGKAHLNIQGLQQSTEHIKKNKLSDKFSRREMQFYDLYIKKDSEDLAQLKENQFPLEIDADQYYNEMEVDDFSNLFENQCLIEERFGQTIEVKLTKEVENQRVTRQVKEKPELVRLTDNRRNSGELRSAQMKNAADQKDPELLSIHASLKQFEKEYAKGHEEIAEIFCKVSGRLNKMKDYLENRPVIEWSYLEDLALSKPDDSAEFQVLLQTKGWEEIMIRRDFLHASPLIAEEIANQ